MWAISSAMLRRAQTASAAVWGSNGALKAMNGRRQFEAPAPEEEQAFQAAVCGAGAAAALEELASRLLPSWAAELR